MPLVETTETGGRAATDGPSASRVATEAGLRFSIIIPLESHRGQALECVRGWAERQVFPREQFEIVLASPGGKPPPELDEIRRLLAPQDQLVVLDQRHDMGLCARAAREARGELLFFTESHCLPEPRTLADADAALTRSPEWAGLSIRSLPITGNLLSQIEAEFYGRDIEYGANEHPWRKVLDQCFLVRRSAYFEAGGFDSAFGHFAEWLIAARLHALGLKVGYAPEARIHHLYVGKFGTWREFTEDFVDGQLRYLALEPADPARSMFDEVPEWSSRYGLRRVAARRMCRLLLDDLRRSRDPGRLRLLGTWCLRAAAGPSSGLISARLGYWPARVRLQIALLRRDRARAEQLLVRCCEAIATVRRSRFRRRWLRAALPPTTPLASGGAWDSAVLPEQRAVGFHIASESGTRTIRWSEPAASVELPLTAGRYTIELEWLFLPAVTGKPRMTFYLDERPVPDEDVRIRHDRAEIRVAIGEQVPPARLGWACTVYRAPGDARQLGLPVTRIGWKRAPELGRAPVSFACDGAGTPWLVRGWSTPESWGTWSIGEEAILRFAPAEPWSPGLAIAVCYRIFPPPDGSPLVVECRFGDWFGGRWELDVGLYRGELVIELPVREPSEAYDLTFVVVDPKAPAELGLSPDERRLGIGVEQARLASESSNVGPEHDNGRGGR